MDGRPDVLGLGEAGVRTRLDLSRQQWRDVLDRTFEVVKAAPFRLLAATAVVDFPAAFAIAALVILVERVGTQNWGQVSYAIGMSVLAAAIGLTWIAKPIAEGAAAQVALEVLGLSEEHPWKAARANASTLIALAFARVVVMLFGGVLFVGVPVAGVIAGTGYWAQVATHEKRGFVDTIRRCLQLARVGWFDCLWLAVFAFVVWLMVVANLVLLTRLLYMLSLAVTPFDVAELLIRPESLIVIAVVARVFVEPVVATAYTISYVDARAKVDAFDLTVRAQTREAA